MYKRTLERKLLELKDQFPVLALFGPRQSGKTTLARTLFPNYRYVNLESFEEQELATEDPKGFLERFRQEEGVILDEIQKNAEIVVLHSDRSRRKPPFRSVCHYWFAKYFAQSPGQPDIGRQGWQLLQKI